MTYGLESLSQFAEYHRRLDAREVLAHYGAQNCTEQNNRDGTTEIVHSCLLDRVEPHHKNHDQNPSAWVNTDKNLYVCSAYWSGSLLSLIQKLEGKETLHDALPVIGEMLKGATLERDEFMVTLQRLIDRGTPTVDAPMTAYNSHVLDSWAFAHPYMLERGITAEVHQRLRVGFDRAENRVVIPHFWNGDLVGWQKRAIPDRPGQWPGTLNPWPKYRSSSGFPKSETLFAFDYPRRGNHVVVVESPMSVLKAHALGISNVTATFGAKVTRTQAELLADFHDVTVWFDHDPAGFHGGRALTELLMHRTAVRVVDPDLDHDLGDYVSGEAVCDKLETARPAALWLADRDTKERHAGEETQDRHIAQR
jgi:Toprim domain-containing protein